MKTKRKAIIEPKRRTPIAAKADVIVVGGGPSGFAAALAAARNKAKVILIEQYGFLGGMATAGGISLFMPTDTVKGIYKEIVKELEKLGAAYPSTPYPDILEYIVKTGRMKTIPEYIGNMIKDGTISRIWLKGGGLQFNPIVLKYVMLRMLIEKGVKIRFHSFVSDVIKEGNKIRGVIVESKSGRQAIMGKIIIDATGDGDVAFLAGAKYSKGKKPNGKMQPMTMMFSLQKTTKKVNPVLPKGCKKYKKENELPHRKIILTMSPTGRVLVNMTRVDGDGTKVDDLTKAEIEGLKQVFSVAYHLQTHGFEEFDLVDAAPQIGVRETRQILGGYVLKLEDLIKGREFEDVIAVGDYVIDLHESKGKGFEQYAIPKYHIPYRCLLPKTLDKIIVVGRCISAVHEAMSSLRIMPICMAIGEAGGTAAAIVSKKRQSPRKINVKSLQRTLRRNGAFLEK